MEYSPIPFCAERLGPHRGPGRHRLVDDPDESDLVLFTECHQVGTDWTLRTIRTSPIARRFSHKTAVYNERDRPWCCLPGVYVSMPASGFVPRWQVAGSYLSIEPPAARLGLDPGVVQPDLLFSFVGSPTHRCRAEIFRMRTARSHVERVDSFMFHDATSERFAERRLNFARIMLRSRFVLCPRGHGTSSFRLYEALSVGRVPVIISDAWVPPSGPNWDEISLRWPEARVGELPRYLAEHEDAARAMGERARNAYERWFAKDVVLDHQLDQLGQLMADDGSARFPRRGYRNIQYMRTARGAAIAGAKGIRDRHF